MLMYGARMAASRWSRAGTTSTRVFQAPSRFSSFTTPSVFTAHSGTLVLVTMSAVVLPVSQVTESTRATA